MPSQAERNKMYNATTIFESKTANQSRTLWVSSTSTGGVTLQTLVVIDDVESWEDLDTYAAGSGVTITNSDSTFRIVPDDDTTYFKFN